MVRVVEGAAGSVGGDVGGCKRVREEMNCDHDWDWTRMNAKSYFERWGILKSSV
jgi:hypothetical protein